MYVYLIRAGARAYIGATVHPARRLRQHNGELAGGARRTRGRGPWHFHCVVVGFRTWREALQFEWAFKRATRRCRSDATRGAALDALLARWSVALRVVRTDCSALPATKPPPASPATTRQPRHHLRLQAPVVEDGAVPVER